MRLLINLSLLNIIIVIVIVFFCMINNILLAKEVIDLGNIKVEGDVRSSVSGIIETDKNVIHTVNMFAKEEFLNFEAELVKPINIEIVKQIKFTSKFKSTE